jgi:hypothetical protein
MEELDQSSTEIRQSIAPAQWTDVRVMDLASFILKLVAASAIVAFVIGVPCFFIAIGLRGH